MKHHRKCGNMWKNLVLGALGGLAGAATGFSKPSTQYPLSTHVYGLASHLVFGLATDTAIRTG